jgi:1,4-alpha-glucan branching enzyme
MAGRWPHGEEWIHEAAVETYIPLLQALYDLKEEGVPYKITVGITPILAEQLADRDVLANLDLYIADKLERAQADLARFTAGTVAAVRRRPADDDEEDEFEEEDFEDDDDFDDIDDDDFDDDDDDFEDEDDDDDDDDDFYNRVVTATDEGAATAPNWWTGHPQAVAAATFYVNFFEGTQRALRVRFKGNLIAAFKQLQDEGLIEITTCAATHGYLPLLATDSAINAQLTTGIRSYRRHFGRAPRGIWLPECAYRPAYYEESGAIRPGIESFLAEQNIKVFFCETHLITGGQPVGMAAAEAIGPYGAIKRLYLLKLEPLTLKNAGTTMLPYWVYDTTAGVNATDHSGVAVIGRNNRLGMQVWSAATGYPGDGQYREFHRKDSVSGLQYWRVSGSDVDLGFKELWDPERVYGRVRWS